MFKTRASVVRISEAVLLDFRIAALTIRTGSRIPSSIISTSSNEQASKPNRQETSYAIYFSIILGIAATLESIAFIGAFHAFLTIFNPRISSYTNEEVSSFRVLPACNSATPPPVTTPSSSEALATYNPFFAATRSIALITDTIFSFIP